MRHRIHGRKLGRDSEHRRAMLRNLAAGLFEHGQIETTLAKAKAVQPFVEKLITVARAGTLTARRRLERDLTDRRIHAWVAHPDVPESRKVNDHFDLPRAEEIEFNRYGDLRAAPRLVEHVMKRIAPRFVDRDGGYTRIVRTGRHRLGDGGDLVILQLVGQEDGPQIGGPPSKRRTARRRREAFAASRRPEAPVEEPEEIAPTETSELESPETAEPDDPGVPDEEPGEATPEEDDAHERPDGA